MTIAEIHAAYTREQLNDPLVRRQIVADVFANLFEQCVIYEERAIFAVVQLTDIKIDDRAFSALVTIRTRIPPTRPRRPWSILSAWTETSVGNASIRSGYGSFTLWPDPTLVQEVERLALARQTAEIQRLLFRQGS